jgi:hypothetical protein
VGALQIDGRKGSGCRATGRVVAHILIHSALHLLADGAENATVGHHGFSQSIVVVKTVIEHKKDAFAAKFVLHGAACCPQQRRKTDEEQPERLPHAPIHSG